MSAVVRALISDWQAARAALHSIDVAEHPDVVDTFGRTWSWKCGDVYVHDKSMAWPLSFIMDGKCGLPSADLANNPNYTQLCEICRQEWPGQTKGDAS